MVHLEIYVIQIFIFCILAIMLNALIIMSLHFSFVKSIMCLGNLNVFLLANNAYCSSAGRGEEIREGKGYIDY